MEYNGWSNRATWAWGLHFDSHLDSINRDGERSQLEPDALKAFTESLVEEALAPVPEGMRLYIQDMMADDKINWNEISEGALEAYDEAHPPEDEDDAGVNL